jgi:type II secretory pathway pseudopilin PulG
MACGARLVQAVFYRKAISQPKSRPATFHLAPRGSEAPEPHEPDSPRRARQGSVPVRSRLGCHFGCSTLVKKCPTSVSTLSQKGTAASNLWHENCFESRRSRYSHDSIMHTAKTLNGDRGEARLRAKAFSLVEVLVGAAVLAVVVVALASGIICGFRTAALNTENLRATQVLTEKMDLIRACNWNQITNGYNFIPNTFAVPFYNSGSTNNPPGTSAVTFQGTVTIANPAVAESYGKNLRQVTVAVTWTSGHVLRSRSMTTLVSPYGIQTYCY